MEQKLGQNQQQKLTLSPQMREYLRLLQLPAADLRQAVDEAMENNPMLEESPSPTDPELLSSQQNPEKIQDDENRDQEAITGDWEESEPLNFLRRPPDLSKRVPATEQRIHDFQESLLTRPESLFDYLEWQLHFLDLTPKERVIAEEIIGNINKDGYLTATVEEIALTVKETSGVVNALLKQIQEMDPPGVAARTLKEALTIQLDRMGPQAALAREIVRDHLDLVAKKDWKALQRIFNQGDEIVKKAITLIAKLEPKPGRSFYAEEAIAVTPDATVSLKDGSDNDLEIRTNDEFIPRLRINSEYRKMMRDQKTDRATKDFLKIKLASGADFMKALELRKSTLRGITEELVRAQPLFFTRGFSYLRPLRLKDIAEKLDLHESTISRAIHGKYMATPQGMISYKSFFSQKIETQDGIGESQKSIMEKVRALIEKEDPQKPLSDQAIVESLNTDGIQIARRTVAKYRETMKILPTHLRRQR